MDNHLQPFIDRAQEARSAADTFGKNEALVTFDRIRRGNKRMGSGAVQYLDPLFTAVERNLDSVVGLKEVGKLVHTARIQVVMSPLSMDDLDSVDNALEQLEQFIRTQTMFQTRIKATLKNVAREKVQSVKQGFIDDLQTSPNIIKRAIGRALNNRYGEGAAERKKQLLETAAQMEESSLPEGALGNDEESLSPRRQRTRQILGAGADDDDVMGFGGRGSFADLGESNQPAQGPGAPRPTEGSSNKSLDSIVLDAILDTERDILRKVTELVDIQEGQADAAAAADKDAERDREGTKKPSLVQRVKNSAVGKKVGSIFDTIGSLISGGLGGVLKTLIPALGSIAGIATAMIGPALTALGTVLAVVAAAFVGWKVGQWIDKMTGASDKIGDAANWIYSKVTGKETEGEHVKKSNQFVMDQAWEHGGKHKFAKKEDMSLDEARKIQNEWAKGSLEDRKRMETGGSAPAPVAPASSSIPPLASGTASAAANISASSPSPSISASGTASAAASVSAAGSSPVRQSTEAAVAAAPSSGLPKPTSPSRSSTSDTFDYQSYASAVGKRESGGKYDAVNTLGYVGKYQFGLASLEDAGLIKPGTSKRRRQSKATVEDPSIWTISGGLQGFLNSPDVQEKAMREYTERNRKTLTRLKVISSSSSPEQVAGYLAASHLLGPGAIAKRGLTGTDAYGTSASSYFKLGMGTQPSNMMASNPPAPVPATPTAPRAAGTFASASVATAGGGAGNAVVAPVVNNYYNNGNTPTPIPRRINPKNENDTLRAVQGINSAA